MGRLKNLLKRISNCIIVNQVQRLSERNQVLLPLCFFSESALILVPTVRPIQLTCSRHQENRNVKVAHMWIKHIPEDEATGIVAKIYKGTQRSWGGVDNIIKAHSLNTAALRALMTFYNGLMHGDCDLSLAQREMIAVTVSVLK